MAKELSGWLPAEYSAGLGKPIEGFDSIMGFLAK